MFGLLYSLIQIGVHGNQVIKDIVSYRPVQIIETIDTVFTHKRKGRSYTYPAWKVIYADGQWVLFTKSGLIGGGFSIVGKGEMEDGFYCDANGKFYYRSPTKTVDKSQ